MQVSSAWLIYILVVLFVFILLSWCVTHLNLDGLVKLFIAAVIGAIVMLIVIPGVGAVTPDERTWYGLLLIIAFLGPIVLAVWLAWSRGWLWKQGGIQNIPPGHQREFECTDSGCRLVRETQSDGQNHDVYYYEGTGEDTGEEYE